MWNCPKNLWICVQNPTDPSWQILRFPPGQSAFRDQNSFLAGRFVEAPGNGTTPPCRAPAWPLAMARIAFSLGVQAFRYCSIAVVTTEVRFVRGAPLRFQLSTNRSRDSRSLFSSRIGVRRFDMRHSSVDAIQVYTSLNSWCQFSVRVMRPNRKGLLLRAGGGGHGRKAI